MSRVRTSSRRFSAINGPGNGKYVGDPRPVQTSHVGNRGSKQPPYAYSTTHARRRGRLPLPLNSEIESKGLPSSSSMTSSSYRTFSLHRGYGHDVLRWSPRSFHRLHVFSNCLPSKRRSCPPEGTALTCASPRWKPGTE